MEKPDVTGTGKYILGRSKVWGKGGGGGNLVWGRKFHLLDETLVHTHVQLPKVVHTVHGVIVELACRKNSTKPCTADQK